MNIKQRTIIIDNEGGVDNYHRFCDFAILTTDMGKMVEPRQTGMTPIDGSQDMEDWDWTAEDHKITNILFDSSHNWNKMLSDGGATSPPYMGGVLMPKNGR